MRTRIRSRLMSLALVLVAPGAFAQGVDTEIKTDPLQTSDTVDIPISIHNTAPNPPWAGWAGGIVKMHLLDASEIDFFTLHSPTNTGHCAGGACVVSVTLAPSVSTSAPGSLVASLPFTINWWHPSAEPSGIEVTPSVNLPLFTLNVHVGSSDPSNNSDVDATFMFWNIWHLRAGSAFASHFVNLRPSDRLWVFSNITDTQQLHTVGSFYEFPSNGPTPFDSNGHWLHFNQPAQFHLTGGPGSIFYATFLNTATLGIEHVPEPASGLLVLGGITAIALGSHARRRRLRMA